MVQAGQLDANLLQRSHEISEELKELRKLEESYWHAHARANELRDGDKNTSYFHHKATQRKKRNYIRGLFHDQEVWKEEKEEMDSIISKYFSNLFASESPCGFERFGGVSH